MSEEGFDFQRLRQVVARPGGKQGSICAGMASALTITTGMCRVARSVCNWRKHFLAGNVRQMQVEQNQVGPVPGGHFQPDAAAHGREQFDAGLAREQAFHQIQVGRIVLDVENGVRLARLPAASARHVRRTTDPPPLPGSGHRHTVACSGLRAASGRVTVNVLPSPTRLATSMVPPCASMSRLDSASPRPLPSMPRLLGAQTLERRKEPAQFLGRDARAGVADGDAQPVCVGRGASRTTIRTCPPVVIVFHGVGKQVEQHLPQPFFVGEKRTARACPAGRRKSSRMLRWSRQRRTSASTSSSTRRRPPAAWPGQAARLDARDVEHLVDQGQQVPARLEDVAHALLPAGRSSGSISSSWPKPRMALRGVRSSWLMRERNSLLAALARSAASCWASADGLLRASALDGGGQHVGHGLEEMHVVRRELPALGGIRAQHAERARSSRRWSGSWRCGCRPRACGARSSKRVSRSHVLDDDRLARQQRVARRACGCRQERV